LAAFDFDAALRWARFDPKRTLSRRSPEELSFLQGRAESGNSLLLDTCVYIDRLQGRLPDEVIELLSLRHTNHSTVAVQELVHSAGALNPAHPSTSSVIQQIGKVIKAMPSHRVFVPDADILGRAGILAGILSRIQGYAKDDRLRGLQDSVLFLQAQKLGCTVLTSNTGDFDYFLQLFPKARVLFYRQQNPTGR
jgi:predicted nucleic acid-binding protein